MFALISYPREEGKIILETDVQMNNTKFKDFVWNILDDFFVLEVSYKNIAGLTCTRLIVRQQEPLDTDVNNLESGIVLIFIEAVRAHLVLHILI